jgi:flagellar biosynthetic protein FliR
MIDDILQRVPVFVTVVFRMAGIMAMAPMFSSPRTPRRVKALIVIMLALGVSAGLPAVRLPDTTWALAIGIGGEIAFGVAMGMLVSFTFLAAQWAGEMIGMEMGLSMSEMFDPSMGGQGSIVGDMLYFMALAVFLSANGHQHLLVAARASFQHLPALSLGIDRPLVDTLAGLMQGSTILALRLAAPVLITVIVVDLALGLVGRAIPQFNVMQAGLSIRAIVGMLIVIIGLRLTGQVIEHELVESLAKLKGHYHAAMS